LCAYLDWAALRPITEMEYEKICRGPGLSNGEYAWGTTNITAGTTIGIVPEDGTEVFTNPNANCTYNDVTYTGGDGGRGPVRVGIHAKVGSTSREASGATYYGVLDMSGNVWEMVVMVSDPSGGTTGSPTYDGKWGDGVLDWATGQANESTWPLGNPGGFGFRGGSWAHAWEALRVSARWCSRPGHDCSGNRNPSVRHEHHGGRGAR
jgi:formylglycine-generating enzyme required for sulfatase activity